MAEMIKRMLKEHVIRPALRSVVNSDLVKEAIAETLAEEEFGDPARASPAAGHRRRFRRIQRLIDRRGIVGLSGCGWRNLKKAVETRVVR